MYFVNVYLVDRAYGGPEEGGWWFEYGEPERCFATFTNRRAIRLKKRVDRVLEHWNKDRRPISSVLSEGVYRCAIQEHPAEPFPRQRPRYE